MIALGSAGAAQQRASPLPAYRPSSLSDLVDAVSLNRDGLDDADLTGDVADHALFLGDSDGVGIAARLQADPAGAIFVGWQRRRGLWSHRFLDDEAVAGVRVPPAAAIRLGRIVHFRPITDHLVLETRTDDDVTTSVVMRSDLSPVAFVAGRIVGGLPAGSLVVLRSTGAAAAGVDALERLDLGIRRLETLYSVRHGSWPATPAANPAASDRGVIGDVIVDARTSTVTFSVARSANGDPATRVSCALAVSPPRCTDITRRVP